MANLLAVTFAIATNSVVAYLLHSDHPYLSGICSGIALVYVTSFLSGIVEGIIEDYRATTKHRSH